MEVKSLILVVLGVAAWIWVLLGLNSLIGGTNSIAYFTRFWGSSAVIGIGVLFFGIVIASFIKGWAESPA